MIRKDFHPLFLNDIYAIETHILSVTEDVPIISKRPYDFEILIAEIEANPGYGTRLSGRLDGCIVRHGGRDLKIRIVFRFDASKRYLRFLLASFGGQNWFTIAEDRL